jgi:hypothetical protein
MASDQDAAPQLRVRYLDPPTFINSTGVKYWRAAALSKSRLPIMHNLFIKAIREGPTHRISGCRRRPFHVEWLKSDCYPPMVWISQIDNREGDYEDIAPVDFEALVRKDLRSMPAGTLKNLWPGKGDWSFLQGADVTWTDFVFGSGMIPAGISQVWIDDGHKVKWILVSRRGLQARNGRSW